MKTYKVIKPFGTAKKGDVFTEKYDANYNGIGTYEMTRTDEHKDGESVTQIFMEMSQGVIDDFVEKGYMIEISDENTDNNQNCSKLDEVEKYIDTLLSTYEKDYNNLLEEFENGDIQPCVKVEAETVYYNLTKVLNSIKAKINE